MKILALPRYDRNGPSSRLRIFQYISTLRSSSISIQVEPLFEAEYIRKLYSQGKRSALLMIKGYIKRMKMLSRLDQYDLVWIEKELFPWLPVVDDWIFTKINIPVIVDYDDAIFHLYDRHRHSFIRANLGKKIDNIMRQASSVIVGNEYLAGRAKEAGAKSVHILPTVVDTNRYKVVPKKNARFRIGWIGSPITEKYLKIIEGQLLSLLREIDLEIVLIGASQAALRKLSPKRVKWSEATEVESIQQFDVGIMPLLDGPFERGKCGYKIIQCMACGIPVIASPVGVNQRIIDHGQNGFLAQNGNDWQKYIKKLYKNKGLRHSMGEMARVKIELEYSLSHTGPILKRIFQNASSSHL